MWNNSTLTPLERPEELADKEFLTEEEAANLEQETIDRNERLAQAQLNLFWLEQGTTVVATRRTSLILDPPDGRLPPLTPEAHQRVTSPEAQRLEDVRRGRVPAASWEELDLSDRCIWYRGIPSFPGAYNNNYQIVQNEGWVAILQEHIHDTRFIAIDGRPHLTPAIRQFAGDSRGHWDGDTLVVETTNFNHHALIRNQNLSEELRVVERFTRIGPDTLDYAFTVTDPKTWTQPWGGSLPMTRSRGPMFEYACHEGNYGLTNMLAGARAQEAAGTGVR